MRIGVALLTELSGQPHFAADVLTSTLHRREHAVTGGTGSTPTQEVLMPFVEVGTENDAPIELYYEDHGSGAPVVLIHGYPLSGRAWDRQVPTLLDAGRRVITYDRRGFGNSSRPTNGYDYDTFASDLNVLINWLGLEDVVLIGHSMGTGEVARYLSTYGCDKVTGAALISPIPPFLLQADDNSDGLPSALFDGFVAAATGDGPAWMKGFLDNFYNMDVLGGTLVSDQAFQASWNVATAASAFAAVACIPTWGTDFRADLPKLDVPILVIQGDADRILPYPKTGARLPGLIQELESIVIEGGPHAIAWTHAERVNMALVEFLARAPAIAA
jgi:non-heme chloroperoxidase